MGFRQTDHVRNDLVFKIKEKNMGKIKNALIAWNEDNGYESTQISGWDKKPKLVDLIEIQNKNRKLINKLIYKHKRRK